MKTYFQLPFFDLDFRTPAGGTWSISNGIFNVANTTYGQTYTLTYSYTLNGTTCTKDKLVTISADCEYCAFGPTTVLGAPNTITTIPNATFGNTLSGRVLVKGPVVIDGAVTIAANTILVFVPDATTQPSHTNTDLCALKTTSNGYAYIYVTQNGTLEATKAIFRAADIGCGNKEWQGILVENGGKLRLLGSAGDDIEIANAAEYGIRLLECGSNTNNGELTLNYVSMREIHTGGVALNANPASLKVYKFEASRVPFSIDNCRFELGSGLRIASPHTSYQIVLNSAFIGNETAITISTGSSNHSIRSSYIRANYFENCSSECIKIETTDPALLYLNCNAFATGAIPTGQIRYGLRVTNTGRLVDIGSAITTLNINPPAGNGWPIKDWNVTPKVSPDGWVSLINENTSVLGSTYHRWANEELGSANFSGWGIFPSPFSLYTGFGTPPTNGSSQYGCVDSPVGNGPYFYRLSSTTSELKDELSNKNTYIIHPNPFSNSLTIKSESENEYVLMDSRGIQVSDLWKKVSEFEYSLSEEVISKLTSGIYIVRIHNRLKGTYQYAKVVKQ